LVETITIIDNRTGITYNLPVKSDAINAIDLRQIKTSEADTGLISYDPGLLNTATCKSSITYIDGEKGILQYRGYPIDTLIDRNYLETAYLLINGDLPSHIQYREWCTNITRRQMVHENIKKLMDGFNHDAHPMGILVSTLAALSTFHPDSKNILDHENQKRQIYRLIAKIPTLAAYSIRHARGLPYIYPEDELGYVENFLNMVFKPAPNLKYSPDSLLSKALETIFILHADHEQNCGTTVMRTVASAGADPYSTVAGSAAALYGLAHGGANEAVIRMLEEIGTLDKIPNLIHEVKDGKRRLMGFGHRVYKTYDPRAKVMKKIADKVFEITGKNPLLDIALELERIALGDKYFISRRLYPNVDFYSGLVCQALGFPKEMFTVLFAIPRMSGWLAHWQEQIHDKEQKIVRPKQIYLGSIGRNIPPTISSLTPTRWSGLWPKWPEV